MQRSLAVAMILAAVLSLVPTMAAADELQVRPLDPGWASAGVAPSASTLEGRTCGTEDPPDVALRAVERDIAPYLRQATIDSKKRPGKTKTVRVAFLVLHDGTEGFLTMTDVKNQIAALNLWYARYRIAFVLAAAFEADVHASPALFRYAPGSDAELAAKSMLDRQGYDARHYLRIYSFGPPPILLGFATFPQDLKRNGSRDGVSILYSTVPFGQPPFDLGMTAVHEVGHWLGLLHPFQGGCSGNGDFVADTPAEAGPDFQCAVGRDTCAGGGVDDVTNVMGYNDDACMNHLTQGQIARVIAMCSKYRPLAFR